MPGIPPDCDRLAEKLALLHLSNRNSWTEGTSVCRFKSVPTSVIAVRLVHAWQTRIQPMYPVLFSMFSGEFCLRLKPYLVVKIASDVLTEHCCQVCVLAMMFCCSDCRRCAGMCGKWLRNQGNSSYQRTTCFGLLTLWHGIWKIFLTFDFHILP